MKRFPFTMVTLDSNNNVIEDCGTVWINLSTGTGTGTTTGNKTLSQALTWLSNYMNTPDLDSFAQVLPPYATHFSNFTDQMRALVPITTILPQLTSSAVKIKITNASGYYAIGTQPSPFGVEFQYVQTWQLYDNNDVLLYTKNGNGMPLMASTVSTWFMSADDNISDTTLRYARCESTANANYPVGNCTIDEVVNPANVIVWLRGLSTDSAPDADPYTPGGTTDVGGGTGTFDNTSTPIPVPGVPLTGAVDTGFISMYNPSITQLKALANYLWDSNGLDLDTFKRIFSDPIGAILGLALVPVNPGIGASTSVVLGNINTGVTMPRIDNQYIRFDCGTLSIEEYWGGYLDYSPYTRAEIYLPFIGVKPLNVDDIMGKDVSLSYIIDVLSGGCVAFISAGNSVLYQFIGQCACSIPVTGRDLTNVMNGLLSVVGAGVGAMVATGGAMAAAGGVTVAAVAGAGATAGLGSLARNVTGMKTHVEKSGSMGGMGGMLGVKTPYVILTRPRQALPENQNIFTGYPSCITATLGSCTGFTIVQDIHLAGFSATDDEKAEIERLLKEGVLL